MNKEMKMADLEAMNAEMELSETELEDVNGGDILLGLTLIGGGIAFGIGVYHGWKSSCKKR